MATKLPTAKLLGWGTAAAGSAVMTGLLGDGVGGALAGAFSGVLQNLLSGLLQPSVDGSPSPESLIANHDVRKLVGLAIRDTIQLGHMADRGKLADAAYELWMSEATAVDTSYQSLGEEGVTQLFASPALSFRDQRALDVATWSDFIDSVADVAGMTLSDDERTKTATRLYEQLPEMLRGKVKQDFDGQTEAEGRGFASLQLVMMGRLVNGVEQLLENTHSDKLSGKLLTELKKLNKNLPSAAKRQVVRIDDPKALAALSTTLDQIQTLGPEIDRRLNEITRAVAVADAASRRGHSQTHGRLAWVLGAIAGAVILGGIGWLMLAIGQSAQAEQLAAIEARLREALAPKFEDVTSEENKVMPPELLAEARELLERGNKEQQALAKVALGEHEEADRMIQELKKDPLAEAFRLLTLEGENWRQAGDYHRAVKSFEQALNIKPQDVVARLNLALAQLRDTTRTNSQQILETTKVLYELLDVWERERGLVACAMLQLHLADAFLRLQTGNHEWFAGRAAGLYQKSIDVLQAENNLELAYAHVGLGKAYLRLDTGNREQHVKEAIVEIETALKILDPNKPEELWIWIEAQTMLGVAQLKLPNIPPNQKIKTAIGHFQSSLDASKLDSHSEARAWTQGYLGQALLALSPVENSNVENAIAAFTSALKVDTLEKNPLAWAELQRSLGHAYSLIQGNKDSEAVNKSIQHYLSALEVYTSTNQPERWGRTKRELGSVYLRLPAWDRDVKLLQEIEGYQEVISNTSKKSNPVVWYQAHVNLGIAYEDLPTGNRIGNLRNSFTAYQNSLQVSYALYGKMSYAELQRDLARVAWKLAELVETERCQWLVEAISYGKSALSVYIDEFATGKTQEMTEGMAVVRAAYEEAKCADKLPFDDIPPAE